MNEVQDDGGPAFPALVSQQTDWLGTPLVAKGMTLRDYFAAMAMQAIISTSRHSSDGCGHADMLSGEHINRNGVPVNELGDKSNYDLTRRWVPEMAYDLAEAMLKERSLRGQKAEAPQ